MADQTLSVKIIGDSKSFEGAIDRAQAKLNTMDDKFSRFSKADYFKSMGDGLDKLGTKVTALGNSVTTKVTLPIAAAATVGAKKFAEVDKTMQLTNATMGNSAVQAKLLDQAMKDAAANSIFGMNDAATATLNFARAGLSAEQAASTLAPAMNLAAGEGGNLDTVSAGLVATINGFGDSFGNAEKYANVFANACNNSALDIDSLSQAMSIAAPIFKTAGYSINDAALYMGVMANAGIPASEAANSLKTGLARLVSPAKDGAAWLDRLGVSVVNADGSMKDSVTIQRELHDAFAGLSESEQMAAASAIFGKNQMSKWLALINTAPDEVASLSGALTDMTTVQKMADAMMSGFGGSLEKLKSGIDVAATSFGQTLAPVLTPVVQKIQSLIDWYNALDDKHKQTITRILLLVASVGPLLVVFGGLMSKVGGVMKLIGSLGSTFGSTGMTALQFALKIGKIAGIAGLVVAALVGMYQNSESFRNAVNGLVSTALTALIAVFQALKPAIDAILEALGPVMKALGDALAPIIQAVSVLLKASIPLLVLMAKAFAAVVQAVVPVIEKVASFISLISGPATAALNGISNLLSSTAAWFMNLGTKAQTVASVISGTWANLKAQASATWEGIKNAVTGKISAAADKVKAVWKTVHDTFAKKISLPHINLPHLSVSGKFSINPPSVPKFGINWYAKGGIFDKASVIGVGEGHEPEAVTPISKLKSYVADAVTNAKTAVADNSAIDGLARAISGGFAMQNAQPGGEYRFIVELGGARVAEKVYKLNKEGKMIMEGA